jgi:hypothetical protein
MFETEREREQADHQSSFPSLVKEQPNVDNNARPHEEEED